MILRIVHGAFCVILLTFAAVQYNDPDAGLWIAIYSFPALLALFGAVRPQVLYAPIGRRFLIAALMLSVAGMVYYWPTMPGFWHRDVWWVQETAREGMGLMIVTVILLIMSIPLLWKAE